MDESKMTRPAPRLAGKVGRDDSGASLQFFETLWVSPGGRKTQPVEPLAQITSTVIPTTP